MQCVDNSRELSEIALIKGSIAGRLRKALLAGSLEMHYQPQIDLKSGQCTHFEALLRWRDRVLGEASPAIFVPVAEELGFAQELTWFVIEKVASDLRQWRNNRVPVKPVAINISALDLSNEANASRLLKQLEIYASPDEITLELTETSTLRRRDTAMVYMHKLRDAGYRIALDDFGTGYCSLAYLHEFPIAAIKFDRSFVSALLNSQKCRIMLRSFLSVAQQLGLKTVAEGVEMLEQADWLRRWQCSLAQGYYFSKPLPYDETAKLLLAMQTFLDQTQQVVETQQCQNAFINCNGKSMRTGASWFCMPPIPVTG